MTHGWNRTGVADGGDRRRRVGVLAAIAAASLVLWKLPFGGLALYPFTLLSTWFHEMGHGLAAILTGGRFDHLVVYADGSGYAMSASSGGRLVRAVTAAAGPMGPAVAGAAMILASRTDRTARIALQALGCALIISTAIWVRSPIGWLVLPGIGVAAILVARVDRPSLHGLAAQVLGVQACISVWRQLDYLFSSGGYVGGQAARSDTAAIADALLLPYWFWGAAISAAIAALLWWSLRKAFRA